MPPSQPLGHALDLWVLSGGYLVRPHSMGDEKVSPRGCGSGRGPAVYVPLYLVIDCRFPLKYWLITPPWRQSRGASHTCPTIAIVSAIPGIDSAASGEAWNSLAMLVPTVPHASSQGCCVLSPLPAFPITPQSKRTVPSYTEISGKEPIACSISYPMQYLRHAYILKLFTI